ncbi:sigma 54-interacting transcriptional regulator [bacterium]|nr:sigma 54-interacting transcriptional regulator [bacterium]
MWNDRFEIIIVDPEDHYARALADTLRPLGFEPRIGANFADARSGVRQDAPDFALIGITRPRDLDVKRLREELATLDGCRTLVLVAQGMEGYEHVLRSLGVRLVLPRDLEPHQVAQWLLAQGEIRQLEQQNVRLSQMIDDRVSYESLIGGSAPMRAMYRLLDQVARTDGTVLISGEDGVEKIEVAQALHARGSRARNPIVVVDCAACAGDPAGSEVFGPVGRGAHALGPHQGHSAFARAGKGTIVLHRIEMLPAPAQRRLLEFLHHPFFQDETPGAPQPLARIMVTADPNLFGRVESGQFDRELFYRMNVLQVRVPPLRERREDIPMLAQHFLRQALAAQNGRTAQASGFSSQAMLSFFQHDWPRNLVELKDVVEQLVGSARGAQIEFDDLPEEIRGKPEHNTAEQRRTNGFGNMPLKEAKRRFETEYFNGLLKRTRGNMTMASRFSRVGRPYLYKKIREYGIEPEKFR